MGREAKKAENKRHRQCPTTTWHAAQVQVCTLISEKE